MTETEQELEEDDSAVGDAKELNREHILWCVVIALGVMAIYKIEWLIPFIFSGVGMVIYRRIKRREENEV